LRRMGDIANNANNDTQDNNNDSVNVSVFGRQWMVFPKVIVFDVDETLWPFWIDTHTTPPYRRVATKKRDGNTTRRISRPNSNNAIIDAAGNRIHLFDETETVLTTLRKVPGLKLAYASRTGAPGWMEELAKLIQFESEESDDNKDDASAPTTKKLLLSMWDLPDYKEVYPGSKLKHFRSISQQSGVPCDEMLFFDDEPYSNLEVSTQLGTTFVDATGGISVAMVVKGLEKYQNRRHHRTMWP